MKRFATATGGHPLYTDDLTFVADANYDFLRNGMYPGLEPDSDGLVIQGCEVTLVSPTVRDVSPGYVYYRNEVYRVPGTTISGTAPWIKLVPSVANLSPSRVYQNAATNFPYKENIMTPVGDVGGLLATAYLGLFDPGSWDPRYIMPRPGFGMWHYVGESGEPPFGDFQNNGAYGPVRFRRTMDGVELAGVCESTIASPGIIFTLPTGFQPRWNIGLDTTTGVSTSVTIEINAVGEVNVIPGPTAGSQVVRLDGLKFVF